jgi:opacity protein-like surface antigen
MQVRTAGLLVGVLMATATWADDTRHDDTRHDDTRHDGRDAAPTSYDDTGRPYFAFQVGHQQLLDDHVAGDLAIDTPHGVDLWLGGMIGYNLSRHWGIELQAEGTEPDIRSKSLGKVKEFSNITITPALRYRHPLGAGRVVMFGTAGLGASLNDINDTGDPKVKLTTDEFSLVGSLGAGFEYFAVPNVAFGLGVYSLIHGDLDTDLQVLAGNRRGQPPSSDSSTMNLTSVSVLAHVRVFLGDPPDVEEEKRRKFLASEGPFDVDDPRFYFYLLGGSLMVQDDEFGDGVELEAPGGVNWTLGGAVGMNLTRHWGAEVQLFNFELNVDESGLGKFAELSNFTVMPQLRYRYPFCGGRLVPFATGGVGVAFNGLNDKRGRVDVFEAGSRDTPDLDIDGTSVAGVVGVGVEYFVNHHLSLGLAVPYYFYPDLDTTIVRGASVAHSKVNLSGPAPMLHVRVYLP